MLYFQIVYSSVLLLSALEEAHSTGGCDETFVRFDLLKEQYYHYLGPLDLAYPLNHYYCPIIINMRNCDAYVYVYLFTCASQLSLLVHFLFDMALVCDFKIMHKYGLKIQPHTVLLFVKNALLLTRTDPSLLRMEVLKGLRSVE